MTRTNHIRHIIERSSRIDDVFHEEDMAIPNISRNVFYQNHGPAGIRIVPIRRDLNEVDLDLRIEFTDKITEEKHTPLEDPDKDCRFLSKILINFISKPVDHLRDFFPRKNCFPEHFSSIFLPLNQVLSYSGMMNASTPSRSATTRYTNLSDRFRSLWTFFQFLGGVFKHQGRGEVPLKYDFQGLYRRIQSLLPLIGDGSVVDRDVLLQMGQIERELSEIHANISRLEQQFPPSLLRKFFDHLKNQDEKILFALVKFYLMEPSPNRDTYDKLDILLTRLSEVPSEAELCRVRDLDELRSSFARLADLAGLENTEGSEARTLMAIIRDIREEILDFSDFSKLLDSQVVDRFRELKGRLGRDGLDPDVLVEIVTTNIALKNKFRELYQQEEVRILEDTNRIFEIERYIERNPGLAHDDLRRQLAVFKNSRKKFDQGRKENNVRREDILALKTAMENVLQTFEPAEVRSFKAVPDRGTDPFFMAPGVENESDGGQGTPFVEEGERRIEKDEFSQHDAGDDHASEFVDQEVEPTEENGSPFDSEDERFDDSDDEEEITLDGEEPPVVVPKSSRGGEVEELGEALDPDVERPGILEILPQDPLLTTALHKIVFALELVVWDYPPEQAARAKELHHMHLEPWEVGAYRILMEGHLEVGTLPWQLQAFFISSAALRIKMEEEFSEITRIRQTQNRDRLMDLLDLAAQSLERARDVDRRFRWFIDDMLFQGDTEKLEQIHRSHFRFLHAYSGLWLEHQGSGGVTPL